jgi:hypothetical protein
MMAIPWTAGKKNNNTKLTQRYNLKQMNKGILLQTYVKTGKVYSLNIFKREAERRSDNR